MVPLASGVFPLAVGVDPEACTGFLVGGIGACLLGVDLGLVLLLGMGISKDVFRGGCQFTTIFTACLRMCRAVFLP